MVPSGIEGIAGVTAMDTSVAGVTVKVVDPEIDPEAAVTVVLATDFAVATPWLLTVATAEFAVLQTTDVVRSCVLPSV